MTTDQRRALRDYISAVGVGKNPVLLKILEEIEGDFELIKVCVIASVFDDQTPRETTEFLRERGICEPDIARVFRVLLADVQGGHFVHVWNCPGFFRILQRKVSRIRQQHRIGVELLKRLGLDYVRLEPRTDARYSYYA